ncbi:MULTISPECIES: exonuclease subunit SbcD [unclassified Colwellia]|uniref:exonuclease subunit SbcD n=1 Tax=unclassified Colwellia TaxID=196834 RepID=UPI0015F494FF|nr:MULTISPECIES: exonuclease subunit SbcD [unclassified Colwellia]MBA6233937.1 exonuclease subunit SbcD [Colwellia sp. MB02u-7]MBA6237589.1 exonuclease subunit SbcD [Colwellia sp. MB02u-11]MBA6256076.1 exonuclease subunit SbcD [Colwellia sp. MB3u-28]MBA6260809.1 exonuclease subunit SbcD [Colwellia sp. MB3u-41]MBA6300610.1 exonuclease subunit SbcD [Colwellia sp. MB3u-22]
MKFRILHTSDWHLGQNFYGKSRANEHQKFLNWLLEQVSEHAIDAVIVAGDIFDTGTPPSYAREMYFDFIVNMHKKKCQLIILAGNHDSVAMLGESKQLLSHLSCQVITSASDILDKQIITLNNKKGQAGAVLCAIPFIRPRDIMTSSAGQSVKEKQQSLQQAISEHYQNLYQQAQDLALLSHDVKLPIIATGHLTTVGVTSSESVRDIYIGTLEAFPANAFPNADYIALGHIHRNQRVAKSEHIRYSGSPIALSFDEATQTKKVLIAEFEQGKLSQVIEQDIPCFQPLLMVKSKLEHLTQDINELVDTLNNSEKLLAKDQKIWLDIEINSAEYLQDLTPRIEALVKELPVEVLLVRRSKKSRQSMPESQKKITLNELSLSEVFATRLLQENWQTDLEVNQKIRLEKMFAQTLEQVQEQNTASESHVEKTQIAGETK